ncbi:hypothetical protein [Paraburkholderia tropica]|uniref:hypothetical protein n=1 Tax=Paraburkholderia tropica TaxID=92647 RepID=UPI002AB5F7A3|nr:hypothetical protein [Paraburkholderia tropica]
MKINLHKVVRSTLNAEHVAACAGVRRRIAWRRRVVFVMGLIGASWAMGDVVHIEAAHEGARMGLDGLIAYLIEKVCAVD